MIFFGLYLGACHAQAQGCRVFSLGFRFSDQLRAGYTPHGFRLRPTVPAGFTP